MFGTHAKINASLLSYYRSRLKRLSSFEIESLCLYHKYISYEIYSIPLNADVPCIKAIQIYMDVRVHHLEKSISRIFFSSFFFFLFDEIKSWIKNESSDISNNFKVLLHICFTVISFFFSFFSIKEIKF